METCVICEINSPNFIYNCCNKQICQECFAHWNNINKTCMFCRQENKVKIGNLEKYFDQWLTTNKIKKDNYVERCKNFITQLSNLFEKNKSFTIQVANLRKIHTFKYLNTDQIIFKYWPDFNTIEVKGGQYYYYDKPLTQDFGWWLHSFVGEISRPI